MKLCASDTTAAARGGYSAQLAARAASLRFADLPPDTVANAQDLVADHIGVALRGWQMPWSDLVRSVALAEGAAPAATLLGGGRTSARNAALVNGTAAHALELDDTHDRSLTHPGAVVIPAALAVGELVGASGASVVAAIVAGYDVQCTLGIALGRALIERGMHPTATLGVFGAAAAAGRLLRLENVAMRHAFGIAASMSAGVMQFSQDAEGTMVKRLFGGLPAERGVLAAQLAAGGFSGPDGAFEGTFGIAPMLAAVNGATLRFEPESAHAVDSVSIKLYPCCKNFHALIEAAASVRAQRPFTLADIAQVDVYGPRAMIEHHLERRPRSTMAAQYSLPFTTAVSLLGDPTDPDSFADAARDSPELVALASRVQARIEPRLQAAFPQHFGGGLRVRLTDGAVLDAEVLDSRGTPALPLDRAGLWHKFETMTRGSLDRPAQERVRSAVDTLAAANSLEPLMSALSGAQD